MVQGNRDVRQDVNDILATREELTEKIELLRGRIRSALWQTKHEIGRSMDEAKQTVNGVQRMINPSYQLHGHPLAMVAVIITLRYFLRQWRKRESRLSSQRPPTHREF
jgi:predicted PurR-regulated permease PerM